MTPRRLAVVGSGVAGLTAAYVASRTAQVTLYEADTRLGGHADTHLVADPATGRELAIDTGFIVHNQWTYPVLLRLFAELGVATQESEMSLSTSDEGTGLEWAGALGARGLSRPRPTSVNAATCGCWRRSPGSTGRRSGCSTARQQGSNLPTSPCGEFLDRGRFSPYFRRHFVEPLVAAVWSCDPAVATDYPAAYLFTFLRHHGMLRVLGSPTWRTVAGGSRSYVDRVVAAIKAAGGSVRTGTAVIEVSERDASVTVRTAPASRSTTPSSSPPTRTRRWHSWPTPRPCSGRSLGPSPTRGTPRCCTPTPGSCRRLAAPGRRGTSAGRPSTRTRCR